MGKGLGCLSILLIILVLNLLFGGLATQYVVEFWGPYIVHHPVQVPFSVCVVVGIFFGEVTIPAAVLTWLISYII